MSEEYGPDFVSLTDEDGNEFELEHVDTIEYKGQIYMAFFPADTGEDTEDDPDTGLIILKVIQEDGEEQLATLDSDEELEEVYDQFMQDLFDEEDEEG